MDATKIGHNHGEQRTKSTSPMLFCSKQIAKAERRKRRQVLRRLRNMVAYRLTAAENPSQLEILEAVISHIWQLGAQLMEPVTNNEQMSLEAGAEPDIPHLVHQLKNSLKPFHHAKGRPLMAK